jgi:hypothetical protein
VFDALGVRIHKCPVSPELIVEALASKDKRAGPKSYPDLKIGKPVRIKTADEGGDGYEVDQERKKKQLAREAKVRSKS